MRARRKTGPASPPPGIGIHQFCPSLVPGDPIERQAKLIRKSMNEVGIHGEIFIEKTFDLTSLWTGDILLIHHGYGIQNIDKLIKAEVPKALIYHDTPPAEHFRCDHNKKNAARLGRSQLKPILKIPLPPPCF